MGNIDNDGRQFPVITTIITLLNSQILILVTALNSVLFNKHCVIKQPTTFPNNLCDFVPDNTFICICNLGGQGHTKPGFQKMQ